MISWAAHIHEIKGAGKIDHIIKKEKESENKRTKQ